MTISGVLRRFFLAYVVLIIVVAVAFQLLGIASSSGVNVGILIGAVLWPCLAFAEKNGRYFTPAEKKTVVWSMIAINLALQLVVGGGAMAAEGKFSAGPLLFALVFVGLIHSVAIYFFVGQAGKMYVKQQEAKAKKLAKGN
ncbi:MAG: hypothetical protein EOO28_31505 [Comamonadaceae bacterium]|nr:MAG: hypothetical protein EOO28_31505 [Comamonadaceae bacterium]